jgi:hypothetical protein
MSDRKPHKCPVCNGHGQIQRIHSQPTSTSCNPEFHTCPACKGECVLWDPVGAQHAAPGLEERVAALEKVAHPQGVLTDPELTEALKRWNEERKMVKHDPNQVLRDLLNPSIDPGFMLPPPYDFRPRVYCGRVWSGLVC